MFMRIGLFLLAVIGLISSPIVATVYWLNRLTGYKDSYKFEDYMRGMK